MKRLIVTEKPSVASTVVAALREDNFKKMKGYYEGDRYIVSFLYGHLMEAYSIDEYMNREKSYWNLEELPFVPKEFKFKVKDDKGIKEQYNIIKSLIMRNDVSDIVNMADSDREGELLGMLVLNDILKNNKVNKNILRAWLPEQTHSSIRNEMKNLKSSKVYDNLYKEGLARLQKDWLIGINYTRLISLKNNEITKERVVFNTGSVIVPIVKKIYDRHMEQKNFVPEKFYTLAGEFTKDDEKFQLSFKNVRFSASEKDKAIAAYNFISNKSLIVKDIEYKTINKQPPKLFSLDILQNKIQKMYKIDNKTTLLLAQSLYEKQLITYPRTNTEYLSENEISKVQSLIDRYNSEGHNLEIVSKHNFNNAKVESHSAIIPTMKSPVNLNEKERLVYDVIVNRFLANFCKEKAIVKEVKVTLGIENGPNMELKGVSIIQEGYLKYENNIKVKTIPLFTLNEVIRADYKVEEKETQAPKNIDGEALNNYLKNPFRNKLENNIDDNDDYKAIMEGLEIGTVATRAGIIANAIRVGYITETKGIYEILPKGIHFINTLNKLGINLYEYQAVKVSKLLKDINKGNLSLEKFMEYINNDVISVVNSVKDKKIEGYTEEKREKEALGKCPRCNDNILEGTKGYYCNSFRIKGKDNWCGFSIYKEDKFFKDKGKNINKTMVKKFLKEGKASIKGFKKKDGKGTYNAIVSMIDTGKYINFKIESFIS